MASYIFDQDVQCQIQGRGQHAVHIRITRKTFQGIRNKISRNRIAHCLNREPFPIYRGSSGSQRSCIRWEAPNWVLYCSGEAICMSTSCRRNDVSTTEALVFDAPAP